MAITAANKTNNLGEGDATSYTTASVAYVANRLYLASVVSHQGTAPTHSITGTGTTWTLVATVTFNTIASANKRISVFRCMPSTSPTETVSISQSGGTMSNAHWSIDELDGIDTSGTNGSGAIVQSNTGNADSGTSLTVTLAAFGGAGNAAFGAFAHAANEATTPGTSFTELSDTPGTESPTTSFETEWRLADADPSASWVTSSTNGGIAIEIKEAVSAGALAWDMGWMA